MGLENLRDERKVASPEPWAHLGKGLSGEGGHTEGFNLRRRSEEEEEEEERVRNTTELCRRGGGGCRGVVYGTPPRDATRDIFSVFRGGGGGAADAASGRYVRYFAETIHLGAMLQKTESS